MILRIKGVKQGKSKSGRIYYYHRKTGTPLPGQPGTTEFMDALARLSPNGDATKKSPTGDTLGVLIIEYKSSPEWNDRASRTREDYDRVFNYLAPLGQMPLKQIDSGFLYALRDKALAAHKRRFANYTLQVLRLLFNWAIRRGRWTTANPAVAVELVKRPRGAPEANRPWTPEELDAVLAAAPPELRVAIALGAFVGLREGDVVTVSWANYDGHTFGVKTSKTGEWIDVRAHYRLREILDATPRLSPNIVVGARGRPYTLNGFTGRFFKLIRRMEARGEVGPDLTFHGLRHTIATWLAEAECDPRTIGAVLGQKSTAMSDHTIRGAPTGSASPARQLSASRRSRECAGRNPPDGKANYHFSREGSS